MKKKKLRIYLDNCCYNRPFDDQTSLIVYLETLSKLRIQQMIIANSVELAWSYMIDYENAANIYPEKRERIYSWKALAVIDMELTDEIAAKAHEYMSLGLRPKDASHIACAVFAGAHFFITTDKKITNKPITDIPLLNPIDYIRRCVDGDK
jgi:predicted nucleic acid-binding protein